MVVQGGMADIGRFAPRPGVDYPRNLVEFNEFFATEESCRRYLERLRWREVNTPLLLLSLRLLAYGWP